MYNQWNSANVDQLVLRKGDGCVLYSGPEGRVVRDGRALHPVGLWRQ